MNERDEAFVSSVRDYAGKMTDLGRLCRIIRDLEDEVLAARAAGYHEALDAVGAEVANTSDAVEAEVAQAIFALRPRYPRDRKEPTP